MRHPQLTEKQFQAQVIALAQRCGYLCYHTHDSRRSAPGFPDLVMVKPGRPLLCIELKTLKGALSSEQQDWLERLTRTSGAIRAEVWRPDMWSHIEEILVHGLP